GHKRLYQGGLAQARLARDKHHLADPPEGPGEGGVEAAQGRLPPHRQAHLASCGWRAPRGRRRPLHRAGLALLDRGHAAIAAAVQRLDQALRLPRIADRSASLLDAGLQRRITDKLLGPQVLEELLLGDNAVTLGDEVAQDVEDLGAELDERARAAQFTAV